MKYNRNNKKYSIEESRLVFRKFYYDILGHGLHIVGEYEVIFPGWKPRWTVNVLGYTKINNFVRSHWWRGNQ